MSKDPAFLWYPNDYMGGTMGMTFEEKGAYVHLLMMQFNRGHMTSHMIGQEVGQLWDKLRDKFTQDAAGLWYNQRLELEINRRQSFVKSRRNNVLGVNQYTKKEEESKEEDSGHMDGHMTSHMENENKYVFNKYYDAEILKSQNDPEYAKFVKFLFGENGVERPFQKLLNMDDQIGYKQFLQLRKIAEENRTKVLDTVRRLENYNKKTYKSFYLTMCNWLKPKE